MSKIAIITDTHHGVRNDSPVFHEYFDKSFKWFFEEIDKQNIEHIIHAGDVVDRRKYVNYVTAHKLRTQFLDPIDSRRIETHIICGNHDVTYKNTNYINALDELIGDRYPSIHLYINPAMINIDGLDIQLLPWINQENWADSHHTIQSTTSEILIGHLELLGFELFRGVTSDHGESKELFSKFDMVMSGHYHHKSTVDNIHYLGAFTEHTWSDYNDPRGFHIFDTDTRKLEFHQNPFVMFKMISYDDVKYPDIMEKIAQKDYFSYKDSYVKIVCVNRTNPYAFDLLLDKLNKVGVVDISIVEDLGINSDTGVEEDFDQTQDTPTIINRVIDNLTLPVNNSIMKNYMLELYKEAISLEHTET